MAAILILAPFVASSFLISCGCAKCNHRHECDGSHVWSTGCHGDYGTGGHDGDDSLRFTLVDKDNVALKPPET